MNRPTTSVLVLLATGAVVFGLVFLVRRRFPRLTAVDVNPWSSTLSYVATAYGVVVGFAIIFLFGVFTDARQAVGEEATSIGTAFDEVLLFPDDAVEIQHALICYSRAVPELEWPALRDKESAPEVDDAYRDIILALGNAKQPATATFQPAAATNIFVQVGNISSAREARLVAAETVVPGLLWGLLLGGGVFVLVMIFVVTIPARPGVQAVLVSLSSAFTAVLILIVLALSTPFAEGAGRVSPELIEQTTAFMVREAPDAAQPCSFEGGG